MIPPHIESGTCVTATQLVRDFPEVRRLAEHGPIHITSHGRTELVVLSPHTFAHLTEAKGPEAERLEWKLSVVLDTVETNILILDENLYVRGANMSLCETFEQDPSTIVGKHISQMVRTPADHFLIERLGEVYASGQPEVMVVPCSIRPGRTVRINIKPWPKGVAMFGDDITERVNYRDRQIADHASELSVQEIGGLGVVNAQSSGTILSGSLSFCQMMGAAAESLPGVRLHSLFAPRSRATIDEALTASSKETRRYEVEYLREGIKITAGILTVTPYWTVQHHACAAIALYDPAWHDSATRTERSRGNATAG